MSHADLLWLVGVLIVPLFGSPAVSLWIARAQRRRVYYADLERRKRVAEQTELVRRLLAEQLSQGSRLQVVHSLVNSNLLAAQERELVAATANVASMRELIELKEAHSVAVSPETRTALATLARRLELLQADVETRRSMQPSE